MGSLPLFRVLAHAISLGDILSTSVWYLRGLFPEAGPRFRFTLRRRTTIQLHEGYEDGKKLLTGTLRCSVQFFGCSASADVSDITPPEGSRICCPPYWTTREGTAVDGPSSVFACRVVGTRYVYGWNRLVKFGPVLSRPVLS